VRAQQESEFTAFVTGSGPRLLRLALLLTGDRGHAEDLLQTALERTARHWHRLDGAPEAYARVVVSRLAVDRRRRLGSRVREVFTDPPESSVDDVAGRIAIRSSLMAGLLQLPPRQRAVLVLRFFEDLSQEQTAAALGITPGTVASTTTRAAARLRALLPDLAPQPDGGPSHD
jgi:RNA polymerase sigma-70 factor (sigma-E family)